MMCDECKVKVHSQHEACPLCHKKLGTPTESITSYPNYKGKTVVERKTAYNILIFISITAAIITITINMLTFSVSKFVWAPIVCAAIIYLWVLIKDTILAKKHIVNKLLRNYIFLALLLATIDLSISLSVKSPYNGWSVNYVIPLVGIGVTFIMTILAVIFKSLWQSDIGYILAMFFINLIPSLLVLFNISDVVWPSVAAMVCSVIILIGMYIFYKRQFKREMSKRFHN